MSRHIVKHLSTNESNKRPASTQIELGEIAVRYLDGDESLMIKNSANEIIEFKSTEHFNKIIEENEKVVANALTDLNSRTEIIEDEFATPHFKSFATQAEYETALNSGELVYPCVCYIESNDSYAYIPNPNGYNAIAYVSEEAYTQLPALGPVVPMVINADYLESFSIDGVDAMDTIFDLNISGKIYKAIPFPTYNIGDSFKINFKLKSEPIFLNSSMGDMMDFALFFYSAKYLEFDEGFHGRMTDGEVVGPMGWFMPYVGPELTIRFKGDFLTNLSEGLDEVINYMVYGVVSMAGNYPSKQYAVTFEIPSGNPTYGTINDTQSTTVYGSINQIREMYCENNPNFSVVIKTY